MKIVKPESPRLVSYKNLKPGSVFRFSVDFKCVGLKFHSGRFVHLQNIHGKSTFNEMNEPLNDSVLFEGMLIGVEVE